MEARCLYETSMPHIFFSPKDVQPNIKTQRKLSICILKHYTQSTQHMNDIKFMHIFYTPSKKLLVKWRNFKFILADVNIHIVCSLVKWS